MQKSSNPPTELARIIKKRMEDLGIKSNRDLASRANVAESIISRLFRKSSQISIDNIYSILSCLGLIKTSENTSTINESSVEDEVTEEQIASLRERLDNYRELMYEYKRSTERLRSFIDEMASEIRDDDPPGYQPLNNRKISKLI